MLLRCERSDINTGTETGSEKLIMIWRETGILPNLTCCRLKPGVFQVLTFPASPEMLCKSQTSVPEVRNLPLAASGVSRCWCLLPVWFDAGAFHRNVYSEAHHGKRTTFVQVRKCGHCCQEGIKLRILWRYSIIFFFFFPPIFLPRGCFSVYMFAQVFRLVS